jgi:glycosyltransferase involved in cell wall biosynthesis
MNNIGVAVVGDVLDINTWSNTPFFFYTEGESRKLFNQPWRLNTDQFRIPRVLWNGAQVLRGKGAGGYQYSEAFLNRAEAAIPAEYFSSTVITFNQLFPRADSIKSHGGRLFYYIDVTLHELFRATSYGVNVPSDIKNKAIALEKRNYENAAAIVCMAGWIRESLLEVYKLPAEKIFVIMPGANLPSTVTVQQQVLTPGAGITRDLVLGFVGKDWKRKGLPVLIEARDLLEQAGYRSVIKVIGNAPPELARSKGVIFSGFIDKGKDYRHFVDEISSCDFGCLFSSSEALGISVLEFLRVGVPVAGYAHQGSLDTLLPQASIRFHPDEGAKAIADRLAAVISNEVEMHRLKTEAVKASSSVSWERAVREWSNLLNRIQ